MRPRQMHNNRPNNPPGPPPGKGMPPNNPPGGPNGKDMKPNTPPPPFMPQEYEAKEMQVGGGPGGSVKAVDPGSMYPCLYSYVYIWPERRRRGFWMYVTYIGQRSIAGWVWNGWFWMYQGMDTNRIRKFYCY